MKNIESLLIKVPMVVMEERQAGTGGGAGNHPFVDLGDSHRR